MTWVAAVLALCSTGQMTSVLRDVSPFMDENICRRYVLNHRISDLTLPNGEKCPAVMVCMEAIAGEAHPFPMPERKE
jgi:hypothetical protein